jgi:hypothetical protein
MRSKGQSAAIIPEFITAFFTIAIIVFMYFMFQGRYLDVQVIVEGNELERRTINTAQVLMSSKDVVWSDGTGSAARFYRGVLDVAKLDEQMVPKSQYSNDELLDRGVLKDYLTYPGTVTEITIRSGDTEDAWFTAFADYGSAGANGFYTCLAGHIDLDFATHYEECQTTYTGANRFEKIFPVLVRDSAAGGALHPATMTIVMTSI